MADPIACALAGTGIAAITAIELYALKRGLNGKILAGAVAAIGVIVGWAFGVGLGG